MGRNYRSFVVFKQCIILAVSLLMTAVSYAGTFSDCPLEKDGSCKKSRFGLGLTGLYLQAYSKDVAADASSFNAPSDWAGILEGSYYFEDRTDLTINWMYYDLDYRGVDTEASEGGRFAKFDEELNIVNAELGRSFDLSPKTIIRLAGGVQYLNLNGDSAYDNGQIFTARHRGVGPRVGLNARYKFTEQFSVYANNAVSILLGRSTRYSIAVDDYNVSRSYITFPELETKLGLSHNHLFKQGMVTFSAGWSVVNYFNLIGKDHSDLTLSGPFLEAKWRG